MNGLQSQSHIAKPSFFETNKALITPESVEHITDIELSELPTVKSSDIVVLNGVFIIPSEAIGKMDDTTCRDLATSIRGKDMHSDSSYHFPLARDFVSAKGNSIDINDDRVRVMVIRSAVVDHETVESLSKMEFFPSRER